VHRQLGGRRGARRGPGVLVAGGVRGDGTSHHVGVRAAERDEAVKAVRDFYSEHGRLPFKFEWERATATRPARRTIERRWGWRALLAEAVNVRPDEIDLGWDVKVDVRYRLLLGQLLAAWLELGRWPIAKEWERAQRRPSYRTYLRYFGSWREACLAASREGDRNHGAEGAGAAPE
jgi:hypothetical protein